jgi:hypothetical protein
MYRRPSISCLRLEATVLCLKMSTRRINGGITTGREGSLYACPSDNCPLSTYTYRIFILYLTPRMLSILKDLIRSQVVQNSEVSMQYQFSVPISQVCLSRSHSERSESVLQTTSSFHGVYFKIIVPFTVRFPN